MTNPRISVIMPVLLKPRPGITHNPEKKFIRAINSFLQAHSYYNNSELVIVSDGCSIANRIVAQNFKQFIGGAIKLFKLPPRLDGSVFVGSTRQYGIDKATGDILCNLDADDYILPHHLKSLVSSFKSNMDWCYFNYFRKLDNLKGIEELIISEPNLDSLCTVNVAWRKPLDVSWIGADGRQDNKAFNSQLLEKYPNKQKVFGLGYYVCNANISAG